jgi:hypothetical protein
MVMNAFDTNFDAENEFYAVNTIAFHYAKHPIAVALNELVRIYLVNITEFDPINSFHLHAGMFNVYRTGTRLEPHDYTDLVTLGQGGEPPAAVPGALGERVMYSMGNYPIDSSSLKCQQAAKGQEVFERF